MKTCKKCHVEKPLEMFFNRSDSKDGKASMCRACSHEYNVSDERRQKRKIHSEIARKNNKKRARNAVRDAIANGALPKAKDCQCKICGDDAQEYHHYRGYTEEYKLTVVPLCARCNRSLP